MDGAERILQRIFDTLASPESDHKARLKAIERLEEVIFTFVDPASSASLVSSPSRKRPARSTLQATWLRLQSDLHMNVVSHLISRLRVLQASLGNTQDTAPQALEESSRLLQLLPGLCIIEKGARKTCSQRSSIDLFLAMLRAAASHLHEPEQQQPYLKLVKAITSLFMVLLSGRDVLITLFEQRGGLDVLKLLTASAQDAGTSTKMGSPSKRGDRPSAPTLNEEIRWACLELMTCIYSPDEFEAVSQRESPRKKKKLEGSPCKKREDPLSPTRKKTLRIAGVDRISSTTLRSGRRANTDSPRLLASSITEGEPDPKLRASASSRSLRSSTAKGTAVRSDKRGAYAGLGLGGRGRKEQNEDLAKESTDSLRKRQPSTSSSTTSIGSVRNSSSNGSITRPSATASSLRVTTEGAAERYGPTMSPAVKRAHVARSASPHKARFEAILEKRQRDKNSTHPPRRTISICSTAEP